MTTVYLWLTGPDGVGHVSLAIGPIHTSAIGPVGAVPTRRRIYKLKQTHEAKWSSRLSVDCRLEAKTPDAAVTVVGLDETAMQTAFADLKARAPLYNMRKHNCATVADYLLETGSGKPRTFVPMMNVAEPLPPGLLRTIVKNWDLRRPGENVDSPDPATIRAGAQPLRSTSMNPLSTTSS